MLKLAKSYAPVVAVVAALVVMSAMSLFTATYDITPVTTGVSGELAANLPVILGGIGALIALSIAVKAVRKFMHVLGCVRRYVRLRSWSFCWEE